MNWDNDHEAPILRWAGGKNWLLKELHRFLPHSFNNYYEPFLGGGTVFFNLQPKNESFLSDINPDLINAYSQLRDNHDAIVHLLEQFINTEEYYYRIRETQFVTPTEKASQFIYLNRTCFNGLYRVNKSGRFNVPYGFKNYKQLFDYDKIKRCSEILKSASLQCLDFEETITTVGKNDLIFLDPPYTVTHIKNGFIKYNDKLFSWEDQQRLASFIVKICKRGGYYILTNAKHDLIRNLFGKIDPPTRISRSSVMGGKLAKRGLIEEYIFTNAAR